MSNYRQPPSANSANDDKIDPRQLELQTKEVKKIAEKMLMAHYEDARLMDSNNCGNNNYNNNSTLSPGEQANNNTATGKMANNASY